MHIVFKLLALHIIMNFIWSLRNNYKTIGSIVGANGAHRARQRSAYSYTTYGQPCVLRSVQPSDSCSGCARLHGRQRGGRSRSARGSGCRSCTGRTNRSPRGVGKSAPPKVPGKTGLHGERGPALKFFYFYFIICNMFFKYFYIFFHSHWLPQFCRLKQRCGKLSEQYLIIYHHRWLPRKGLFILSIISSNNRLGDCTVYFRLRHVKKCRDNIQPSSGKFAAVSC